MVLSKNQRASKSLPEPKGSGKNERVSQMTIFCRLSQYSCPWKITASIHTLRKGPLRSHVRNASSDIGPSDKIQNPSNRLPKLVLVSAVIASATFATYHSGYWDKFTRKEPHCSLRVIEDTSNGNANRTEDFKGEVSSRILKFNQPSSSDESSVVIDESNRGTQAKMNEQVNNHEYKPQIEPVLETEIEKNKFSIDAKSKTESGHAQHEVQIEKDEHSFDIGIPHTNLPAGAISVQKKLDEETVDFSVTSPKSENSTHSDMGDKYLQKQSGTLSDIRVGNSNMGTIPPDIVKQRESQVTPENSSKDMLNDSKHIKSTSEANTEMDITGEQITPWSNSEERLHDLDHIDNGSKPNIESDLNGEQASSNSIETLKNEKLIIDLLQVIHAAEKRQAELDAHVFSTEKRALKEKYEKQLRDLRARELMLVEEAAILDKEIKREKSQAAAAISSHKEKMEEKVRTELERKEVESNLKLNKFKEMARAEVAAAIAEEKAAQIERMIEANHYINALDQEFHARFEEALLIREINKICLGTLALESTLINGLPVQQEIDALAPYLTKLNEDSLIQLILTTLPHDAIHNGTDTPLILNRKFNAIKGKLRHYILIPLCRGGIWTHAFAYIASVLRIKDADESGCGIESVIKRVENFLADGKLAEAAEALEESVHGSQAELVAYSWAKQARNRAVVEQALAVLQSYATCVNLMRA